MLHKLKEKNKEGEGDEKREEGGRRDSRENNFHIFVISVSLLFRTPPLPKSTFISDS
jgi:hypothetical protein